MNPFKRLISNYWQRQFADLEDRFVKLQIEVEGLNESQLKLINEHNQLVRYIKARDFISEKKA